MKNCVCVRSFIIYDKAVFHLAQVFECALECACTLRAFMFLCLEVEYSVRAIHTVHIQL